MADQQHALRDWHRLFGLLLTDFDRLQAEDFAMSCTFEDFGRDYVKKYFSKLTLQERKNSFVACHQKRWKSCCAFC
jgi:hypothetical protein